MSELIVKAGDHLLVTVSGTSTPEQCIAMREFLLARLSGLENVTIIAGASSLAVYRPIPTPVPPPHRPNQMAS